MRRASSVSRRGAELPEKNIWSHLHDALQHLLSGIDRTQRLEGESAGDSGPPQPLTGEDWST